MEISGKVVAITGAGNGIGRAVAIAMAQQGADVAIGDLELDAAKQVAGEVEALGRKALAFQLDVVDESSMQAFFDATLEQLGPVDILMSNAGVSQPRRSLYKTSRADYEWIFGVNVGGILNALRVFVPHMVESGRQCWLINTGSEHSLGLPHTHSGLYTASKHAVLGMSDALRNELPDHVGVSVLCPGIVETSLWRSSERRAEQFGGSTESNPAGSAVMAEGMPAEEVAQRLIQGVRDEHFIIPTHAHVERDARKRWEMIEAAFSTQAPHYEGDEKYDVNTIVNRFMASQANR